MLHLSTLYYVSVIFIEALYNRLKIKPMACILQKSRYRFVTYQANYNHNRQNHISET